MFSFLLNWVSLRKKIAGLALIPALVCSIVFGGLIWASSRTTSKLVGAELTRFMAERTMRATVHGYNTSIVTYGYVMEGLDANLQTAQLLLGRSGGVKREGTAQTWAVTDPDTHQTSPISGTPLAIGSWHTAVDAAPGPLADVADQTGRLVVLLERISPQGDLLRVGGARPHAAYAGLGVTIPAHTPLADAITAGNPYHGTLTEQGSWYSVACTPLRAAAEVIGALCLGTDNASIRSLKEELAGNFVGANGSASVFFVHGPIAGRMLIEPTGISKRTESLWLPQIRRIAETARDNESATVHVIDPESGAEVVVCYRYFAPWDWGLVITADSRDLALASKSVGTEFNSLLWRTFIAGFIALLLTTLFAIRIGKRLVDPMADLTIRLTSNATQIASSARQQAANVANINTSGNEIATAVNQISATSKELLRATEQLAEDAEKTSEVAIEGSRGLRALATSMESLSTATHSITDKLTIIRTKAAKINSVVTAITKVADQTNLLSLNAAIEAEKAGEAGAGFAVVAREIRRLADQSAAATLDIEQMVEAMQEAVSSGVAQTRELTDAMDHGIAASEGISGQFSDIIHRVESMVPRYEAVHEGMQNQSEGAQQISEAMWQLTEMGRQTSESVNDLNDVSHQLHAAVRILKERIIHTRARE